MNVHQLSVSGIFEFVAVYEQALVHELSGFIAVHEQPEFLNKVSVHEQNKFMNS